MDEILNEIEQFQEETDQMVNNMANIEQLLSQAEQSNEEHKRGLTQDQIRKLKLFTYQAAKQKGEEDVCSICLVPAQKGDRIYELVCRHLFHQKCIKPWFEKSTVCPNCRRDLQPESRLPSISRQRSEASMGEHPGGEVSMN